MNKLFISLFFLPLLLISCASTPEVPKQDIVGDISNNVITFDVSNLHLTEDFVIANKTRTKATFNVYDVTDNKKVLLGTRTLGGDNTEPIRPDFSWTGIKKVSLEVQPSILCFDSVKTTASERLYVYISKFAPKAEYTDTIKKENSFVNAKIWLAENLANSNVSIQFEDKDAGIIVGNTGYTEVAPVNPFSIIGAYMTSNIDGMITKLSFTFKITLKDNTATIAFYNFLQNTSNENASYDNASIGLESLAKSFFKALN